MSSGAGSVGVSARPALPTTMSTSGNRQKIMSRAFRSSAACVTDIRGTVIGMSITMPSSSGVRNSRCSGVIDCAARPGRRAASSPPRAIRVSGRVAASTLPQRRPAADDDAEQPVVPERGDAEDERQADEPDDRGRPVEQVRQHRAVDPHQPADQPDLLLGPQPAADEHRAQGRDQRDRQQPDGEHGERLGERQRVEHLPFQPAQREDRQEREEHDERPRRRSAGRPRGRRPATSSRVSPRTGRSPYRRFSRCMTFSAITIDESTSTPIEMASPASDIRFVWTSTRPSVAGGPSGRTRTSTASGSVSATTNAVRTWRRTTRMQTVAVRIASSSVPVTVPIVPAMSGVRS